MKIAELIPEELLIPELRASDNVGVLEELAGILAQHCKGISREELVRVLLEREKQGSTAIGKGIAIPHGKLDIVGQPIACLGRSKKGVEFGAADGKPTHFFFALIVPEKSAGAHLKALARISRLSQNSDFRKRLLEAKTAHDMHELLVAEDAKR